ncbi:MAG: C4-type zinc ribbon domain-containing protein [Syntrophaceae bacterium]
MREQLTYLIELQNLDLIIGRINNKKMALPEKITQMDEEFGACNTSMEESRTKLEELNKRHSEKEEKLKRGIDTLKKAKERLLEVKTNKEYQAILKEIETIERKNSEIEDEIISSMEEIDHVRVELKEKEKDFNAYKLDYEKEKKKIAEEISQIDSELSESLQKSNDLRKQVRIELQKRYETIKGARNGLAVVPVWKEVCGGCHMNIPPQLYIELQRSAELLSCPNCNRIIYWHNQDKTDG